MTKEQNAVDMVNQRNNDEPTPNHNALSEFLAGFQFVESDGLPIITLDNQRRFYINATARRLMGVKPYTRLSIAYDPLRRSIAVVMPSAVLSDEIAPIAATSSYNVDQRYYTYARHFARQHGFGDGVLPAHFVYERGMGDGSAFVFRLKSE